MTNPELAASDAYPIVWDAIPVESTGGWDLPRPPEAPAQAEAAYLALFKPTEEPIEAALSVERTDAG